VIDSERTVLVSQLQASHLQGSQAVAAVNLIRALGGGWGDAKPQTPAQPDGTAPPPAPLAAR
jgi:multidrug efflux system outer membrane protein